MINQRTIKNTGKLSGIGLHTGKKANITFNPALINHGIKFQRIDLKGEPTINADIDNVISVERGTKLSQNNATVATVEHLLAAIVGLQIDNCIIELDSSEPPIMDGSSKFFVEAFGCISLINPLYVYAQLSALSLFINRFIQEIDPKTSTKIS